MEETGLRVGARLRALREEQGLTLRGLADACGLSVNAISLIERGETSPTVSTLQRLAAALKVPITGFFQESTRRTAMLVRHSKGLRSLADGAEMECLGIGLDNQQLQPFRMVIAPGHGNFTDPVSHTGEEFVHCLVGEIDYLVGSDLFRLTEGDSLLFEAQQPHAYHNQSPAPATLLVIFQSGQDSHHIRRQHQEP